MSCLWSNSDTLLAVCWLGDDLVSMCGCLSITKCVWYICLFLMVAQSYATTVGVVCEGERLRKEGSYVSCVW